MLRMWLILKRKKSYPQQKELRLYQYAATCYTCKKRILKEFSDEKNIKKLETTAILQVTIEVPHMIYVV